MLVHARSEKFIELILALCDCGDLSHHTLKVSWIQNVYVHGVELSAQFGIEILDFVADLPCRPCVIVHVEIQEMEGGRKV